MCSVNMRVIVNMLMYVHVHTVFMHVFLQDLVRHVCVCVYSGAGVEGLLLLCQDGKRYMYAYFTPCDTELHVCVCL